MNKEKIGLKMGSKGFWLSLCAVVVAVTCCIVALENAQAAGASDLTFNPNSAGDGYVVVSCNESVSGALEIPATHNSKPVVEIGRDVFKDRTGLTSVTIPDSVTTIGWYAFSGCTGLTEITIPDSVTTIDWFAFANCTGLQSVTIGGETEIGAGAFSGCTALTDVTIESGVTTIGWSAFKGCTKLENVTIPNTVTTIDRYAFYNCGSIADVYYDDTVDVWNQITIHEGNESLTNATVHAAATSVSFGNVQHNLYLEDLTTIGYHCTIIPNGEVDKFGILIWTGDLGNNVTVETEGVQNKTLDPNGTNVYSAKSDGIYSQYLDVTHYARPYVQIGEDYIYSDTVDEYTAVTYTETVLGTDDEELKNTTVSLLNYGTYAQIYFAANKGDDPVAEEDKINNGLTPEQKSYGWDDEDLEVPAHEVTKDTATESSLNWKWYGTNLSLLDKIQMNMAITGEGVVGMYYWTEEAYNNADVLNASNASGELEIRTEQQGNKLYTIGTVEDIVAQDIGDVFYVCAYDAQGNLGPIRADSVAAYATRLMNSNKSTISDEAKDLAKALLIYGKSAEAYFQDND